MRCCREVEEIDEYGVCRQPTYKIQVHPDQSVGVVYENVLDVSIFDENSDVYDIEVENENHNFVANGIVIHNCLSEDAMLIHRIIRAPEKRIFKVDVGGMAPNEIDAYMEKLITKTKKVPYVDEVTGEYNLRYNLMNLAEDFYLPVRGSDSGMSIESLGGMEFTGIDDIEYLRNKMMAALKVPKAFLNYEEDTAGKSTLASMDVRFARTIQRIQKFIEGDLQKIAIIHLYAQGYRDEELVDFKLELTNPSTIAEKEKVAVWQDKVNVAKDFIDAKIYSRNWIHKHVFNTSEDDLKVINDAIIEDSKQGFRLKKIEEDGVDPAKNFNSLAKGDDAGGGSPGPEGLGGGDEPGGGGLPGQGGDSGGGGGKSAPPSEPPQAAPAKSPAAAPGQKPIAERDQTGRKKASNYPFGEDPLGDGENRRKPNRTTTKNPITHKYAKGTPISFEEFSKPKSSKRSNKLLLTEIVNDDLDVEFEKPVSKISYMDEKSVNI